jgi:hypothetical protein
MSTNGTNTGTQYIRNSTDFNLKTLTLITPLNNGVIDLSTLMIELNLFEDIYSSTISGEVVIQDSLGLISKYLLNGTEFLQVQLQKTTADNSFISRNYRVYKIGKRVTSDSNNYEVYVINFCSEEFLISEQYRISKSVKGTMISDIIKNIMNTYVLAGKGNKPLYIDTTSGVYDFVLPNKKIFETINWLSTYALPMNNTGADMLFYENSNGYHFHSLQDLYTAKPYQTYKYDPKNLLEKPGQVNIQQQLTNASDFEVLDFFDTLGAITNGTFSNKVITLDPLQRQANTGTFNYNEYLAYGTTKKMNPYALTNNYKNRLSGTMYDEPPKTISGLQTGTLRMASGNANQKKNAYVAQNPDSVANDINIEKYIPNRVSQLALSNYMKIKISVPGDPLLTAGSVVNFNSYGINPVSFTQSGSNTTRDPDPFYSGKYLVTAVRHIVKNNGYITVLELAKDSVITSYSGTNDSLSQYVNGVQI